MDFRRKFEFGLAWRTVALVGAIALVGVALSTPGVRAGLIVAMLIAVAALASLWNFIRRTNFLVSRFIESVRFEDYSQRFSDPSGGGFDVLGQALDRALTGLQARQDRKSTRLNSSHPSISYAVFCLKKKRRRPSQASKVSSGVGASWPIGTSGRCAAN